MIKRTEWTREQLDEISFRVKVIGGWIVAIHNHGSAFVHDPYHNWEIIDPNAKVVELKRVQDSQIIPESLL